MSHFRVYYGVLSQTGFLTLIGNQQEMVNGRLIDREPVGGGTADWFHIIS